ncbi:MAG: aldose epimerase [Rhodanobacteraceae bacterium]|nr:MAG: aldose epimerase [Rhodanobacteraceae bacterium]
MGRYSARRARLGTQPIVVLTDGDAGRRACIACHGAALLSLETRRAGAPFDVAWGYVSDAEIVARAGSHFAILAPFGGRIADARYRFDGVKHDLQPGVTGKDRGFRHGFVRDADFTVAALAANADAAIATLTTKAIRPRPGYPFSIDLALEFAFTTAGLTLTARMRNAGAQAAPCFVGWHAYFRAAPGRANDWSLHIPAQSALGTDASLITLPGSAAYVPLDAAPTLDFRQPRAIGTTVLDTGYSGLAADTDERSRTHLTDPATGFQLAVWQERGVLHAFTGDTLGAGARRAIALEPMECMANAFNRRDCADAIRLEPGATRTFRCGVELPPA